MMYSRVIKDPAAGDQHSWLKPVNFFFFFFLCDNLPSVTYSTAPSVEGRHMTYAYAVLNTCTAAIKSLLTHICSSVALDTVVHPKLTNGHQSHTIRDYTPDFATPAVQIPANPSQIQIPSSGRYKLLAKVKVIRNLGLNSRIFFAQAVQCAR